MNVSADLCDAVVHKLQVGVLVIDREQRVRLINRWLLDAMIDPPEVAAGRPLIELFPTLAGSRLLRAIGQSLEKGLPSVLSPGLNPHPLPLFGKSGGTDENAAATPLAQSVQVVQVRVDDASYCLVVVTDVSATMRREMLLREQAGKLSSLSLTDELTGIANRRRLNQYLDEELRRASRSQWPVSVILLDIDHFKGYNDCYGHLAGDDCLVHLSSSLQVMMQRAGDLLARYGGEEFCVVLADTDEHAALTIAESLREHVESLQLPHAQNSTGFWVTISLGVATSHPSQPDSPTGLLLKADRALYRAKQDGRNRSVSHTVQKG